ncbi:MAG: DUF3078 domain-containing protein [Balneolaceae bacterium]
MFKKLTLTLFILLLAAFQLKAQESVSVSDSLSGWDYGWVAGLNGSQASYSNWSQGGVNNIAASGKSIFRAYYREGRFSYGFLINTRYGKTRIDGEGTRKTDDRLSIRNRFVYDIGDDTSDFSIYGDVNFRTQFDKGYDYSAGPNDSDLLISNFLSPAYFSQNVGMAYSPGEHFTFEAGAGLRQTFVTDDNVIENNDYGLPEGENFRNEAGVNLGASYQQNIASNILMSTSVETFTNVNKSLSSTDIFFSSEFVGQINSLINTSLRLDFVYDDDFSNELQVRQSLSVGISFILI